VAKSKSDRAPRPLGTSRVSKTPAAGFSLKNHKITKMKLADLDPAPYNPRTISKESMQGLSESIRRFGLVQPIVWNKRSKQIIGGHQRREALMDHGIEEADVLVVDLPPEEEKALNVTLNNPAVAGEFTEDLQDLLIDLKKQIPDTFKELRLDELFLKIPDPLTDGGGAGGEGSSEVYKPGTKVTCPHCEKSFKLP
jgi:hypothetical protein